MDTVKKNTLFELLKVSEFRDIQEETINKVLKGENVLCKMPTGGGKTLIYKFSGLYLNKIVIIISPLLALMRQQRMIFEELGLKVLEFNSNNTDNDEKKYNDLKEFFKDYCSTKFIFISPERLFNDGLFEYIIRKQINNIGLIVIDEVHCVSQWGHSFRPSYKMIPFFIKRVSGNIEIPILALTATVSKKDENEICKDFNIKEKNIVTSKSLIRNNLKLNFIITRNEDLKFEKLIEILNKHKNEKIIVYTHKIFNDYGTREMKEHFIELGYNCDCYDSKIESAEKTRVLEDFISGKIKIIFATSAFGMGINIPDIRVVVHFLIPESIEQYSQEIGRAGRDSKESYCYLLFCNEDSHKRKFLIDKSLIEKNEIIKILSISITEKYFNPNSQDEEDELNKLIFYYMFHLGVVNSIYKGVRRIKYFDNISNNEVFQKYLDSKSNKITSIISEKLQEPLEKVNDTIFELIYNDSIRFNKPLEKVVFYNTDASKGLDIYADKIYNDMILKARERISNLNKLIEFIKLNEGFHENHLMKYFYN